MGRKKKIKPNETEQLQTNSETKGTFEENQNESNSNVTGFEPSSENNNSETEKKIDDILSSFNSEAEPKTEPTVSPSAEDFKPRTRGRKPKEIDPPKPVLKVPGKLFLKVHSKVAIAAVGILDKYIDKNNPIPQEYLANVGLSDDELNDPDMIAIAEMAIKEMKLEDNPITVFYVSFGSMILTNFMTLKQFLRNESLKRKEALAQEIAQGKKQQRSKRNAR